MLHRARGYSRMNRFESHDVETSPVSELKFDPGGSSAACLDFVPHKSAHGTMNRNAPINMEAMPPAPTLPELVDLYLLRCQVEGKSVQTVVAYRYTLGRFLRTLREDGVHLEASAVQQAHLYRYLGRFTDLSLDTRHRYFREVRCFFNWVTASGYLSASPFAHLRNVRLPQKIVRVFTPDDLRQLLAACSATPAGARDRAVLITLLDTGLRVSELVRLTLDDVDLETQRVRVLHAKGNKQRVVAFSGDCCEELRRYLAIRGDGAGPLFIASDAHGTLRPMVALRPNGVKQMLRRLGRTTGLEKVHAHRFGTRLLRGRSSRARVSSTCSCCSATHRRTWCGGTRRPTTPSRRRVGMSSFRRRVASPSRTKLADDGVPVQQDPPTKSV